MESFGKKSLKKLRKGFTLLELLVVIFILGLLAAYVVPAVMGKGDEAKVKLICPQMGSISQALDMFRLDNGAYPDTEEGLKALTANPDSEKYPNYATKPYMKKLPKDSWKKPFSYIKEGDDKFELISLGGDKKEGGEGANADIKYSQCDK